MARDSVIVASLLLASLALTQTASQYGLPKRFMIYIDI
jgi:hypothetical protein